MPRLRRKDEPVGRGYPGHQPGRPGPESYLPAHLYYDPADLRAIRRRPRHRERHEGAGGRGVLPNPYPVAARAAGCRPDRPGQAVPPHDAHSPGPVGRRKTASGAREAAGQGAYAAARRRAHGHAGPQDGEDRAPGHPAGSQRLQHDRADYLALPGYDPGHGDEGSPAGQRRDQDGRQARGRHPASS